MKSLFTVLIVGAIAALSWWILSTEQSKQSTETYSNHFIDLFINNFTLTSTDKLGETTYILNANRLEHYNDEDSSQILNPTIRFLQDEIRWLITAETGEIDNTHNLITLRDNVSMKQINSSDALIITTEAMSINSETRIIRSNEAVNIQNGSLQLKSDGMIYDGQMQQLKLLSNVSSVYAPL